MPDVELRISILNINYTFRGFNAISDLKEFCDDRCSESRDGSGPCEIDEPPDCPTPVETVMLRPERGNGGDADPERI